MGLIDNYISGIFIDDDYCHQGLGKELMSTAKKDYDDLSLSVYLKNQNALEFYLGQGFMKEKDGIDQDTNEKENELTWSK